MKYAHALTPGILPRHRLALAFAMLVPVSQIASADSSSADTTPAHSTTEKSPGVETPRYRVENLRCDGFKNPLGVVGAPRLGWK